MNKLAVIAVVLIVIGVIMSCGALFGAGMFMPAQNAAEMSHTVTEVSSDFNHTASLLGNSSIQVIGGVVIVALILIFGIGGTFFIGSHNNTIVKGDQNIKIEQRLSTVDQDLREWVGRARAYLPGESRHQ